MKRIYENIPLQSVLYLVSGLQRIEIIDHSIEWVRWHGAGEQNIVFCGLYKDVQGDLGWNVEHAKVRGVAAVGNTICFDICTKQDWYDEH